MRRVFQVLTERIARAWRLLALVALVAVCHAVSLDGFPLPWQDEVHIVEMGRASLESAVEGSAFAITASGTNSCPFYFLGPVLQELAYRHLGADGPRIWSLAGLFLAALLCRRWVRLRWRRPRLADFAAGMVLLNVLLVHSARLVRVDTWAFALLFLALCVLWGGGGGRARTRFGLVGFLFGVDLFVWPSAVLFAPFVLAECLRVWKDEPLVCREHLTLAGCAVLGAGLSVAVGLLLAPSAVLKSLSDYYAFTGGGPKTQWSFGAVVLPSCLMWAKEALRDPCFLTLAIFGGAVSVVRRDWTHCILGALCFVLMIPSGLHTYRLLYAWPFAFHFVLTGLMFLRGRCPRTALTCAGLLVVTSALSSAVAYAFVAWASPRPSAQAVTDRLASAIGKGPDVSVYSLSFQTYFAGRDLGWRQYRYADNSRVYLDSATNLLDAVNTVIVPREPEFYAAEESFTLFGLIRNAVIAAARSDKKHGVTSGLGRIGASLAFRGPDANSAGNFEQRLTDSGFVRSGTVSFADWRSRRKAWFGALAPYLLSVDGYDDLSVWKRRR